LSTAQLTVLNSDRLELSYSKGHVFLLDLFTLILNYIYLSELRNNLS